MQVVTTGFFYVLRLYNLQDLKLCADLDATLSSTGSQCGRVRLDLQMMRALVICSANI